MDVVDKQELNLNDSTGSRFYILLVTQRGFAKSDGSDEVVDPPRDPPHALIWDIMKHCRRLTDYRRPRESTSNFLTKDRGTKRWRLATITAKCRGSSSKSLKRDISKGL